MKNIIVMAAASIALASFCAEATANGLLLCQQNNPNQISIACGPTQGALQPSPAPIPGGNGMHCAGIGPRGGTNPLPWALIQSMVLHGPKGVCVFTENGTKIGQASIAINLGSNKGQISDVSIVDTKKYQVTPPPNGYQSQVHVTITKLSN